MKNPGYFSESEFPVLGLPVLNLTLFQIFLGAFHLSHAQFQRSNYDREMQVHRLVYYDQYVMHATYEKFENHD